MITVSLILTIILVVIVLVVLFKLLSLIASALNVPPIWVQIAYWLIVLLVVIWLFGLFGVTQPIIR